MQSTDDSALLRQYVGNNSEVAFTALVTRHINLVYSVALRQVGNPHHAEEITQAVFIILAKKAGELRHDKALSSWLFQATRLIGNNFVRSEIRRRRREKEAYVQTTLKESGNEAWPDIAPLLDAAVAGLDDKDRRAILLRFYEGMDLREVGAALGANEEAAKKRVNRALEKLRRFFNKRGVVLPAAVLTAAISANSVQAAPVALAQTATALAIARGATNSNWILTLAKGALRVMAWTKAKMAIVVGAGILLATGTTTVVVVKAHTATKQRDSIAAQAGVMKESVFPAIMRFAIEHQDELPKSIVDLRPYLPAGTDGMDDDHWQIPATGKLTPLLTRGDAILLEQKNVPPGEKRIILHTDGHVERK